MKKILFALSLCLMIAVLFAGCGKQSEQPTEPTKKIMQKINKKNQKW